MSAAPQIVADAKMPTNKTVRGLRVNINEHTKSTAPPIMEYIRHVGYAAKQSESTASSANAYRRETSRLFGIVCI